MAGKPRPRQRVVQPQDESIRYIALTQNQVAVVDATDYEWLMQWPWFAMKSKHSKTFYAARNRSVDEIEKPRLLQMHQALTKIKNTDHWDNDGLNNRRLNLRTANTSENSCNRGRRSDNKSGFKGVHKGTHGKWVAQVAIKGGAARYLGRFDTAEEAARAYDAKARELQGEFAKVNFPG